MVQYLHTPWRDRAELLRVREQFYPSPPTSDPQNNQDTSNFGDADGDESSRNERNNDDEEAAKQHAVSRVSMWMQRGGCPHLVESTALLMAAILSDLHETRARANSSSYALRAAYSAAFSRISGDASWLSSTRTSLPRTMDLLTSQNPSHYSFVTGLLDSQQDKQRKMSMYTVAKTIGLPATFVELRHQATHEQLPSLAKLRSAARKALDWIWAYYWKNLPGEEGNAEDKGDKGKELVVKYLGEEDVGMRKAMHKQLRQWDEAVLLRKLEEIGRESEDPKIISRSIRLSGKILDEGFAELEPDAWRDGEQVSKKSDLETVRAEMQMLNGELDAMDAVEPMQEVVEKRAEAPSTQVKGWARYEGPWKPKPIGVV
ncbi:hypothetical protein ABKA04_001561 [Annulohypoxylon sp. FPYF3050]